MNLEKSFLLSTIEFGSTYQGTEENITPYIEAIYVDKMNVILVEYTFYNEEGIRMLGQYPIGEVM